MPVVKCMDCMSETTPTWVVEDLQVVEGYECTRCGCSISQDRIMSEYNWDGFKLVSTPEQHAADSQWMSYVFLPVR